MTRLTDLFTPTHYDLSLTLQRQARIFSGLVTIHGIVQREDGAVMFHAKDLSITQALVDGKQAQTTLNADELTISHADLHAGEHLITIAFEGAITDPMHGLYPSYYEVEGQAKELLATQFESHHAREVFPCIDEPEAKATFDVTLTTEKNVTVIGNMPIISQQESDDHLVTQFGRTPRMSSYLLAWVVGELHKVTGKTASGTEVSIWATPAQPLESLTFALDIATRTIDFFNDYFDTPYPLPKSDHVALPDFSSGAMENWGLITYREVALLADPATASLENKRQVALVVAHELSHQWFGNLVTMKWWNDLWLNESFANMMEYVAIDAIEPTWDIWLDYASSEIIQALRRDSLDGVQAIQTDVHHPDEISTLFDPSIVYAKGGRLLRMLRAYIGTDALRSGLTDYFKTYAYENTTADDLWRCLGKAANKDIASLMNSWIRQSGYPLVTVTAHDSTMTLHQSQFFIGEHKPSTTLWPIPLASKNDAIPRLMTDTAITIGWTEKTPPLLNNDAVSHYITHYDEPLRKKIFEQSAAQSAIYRLTLLTEHTLLAQAGVIPPATLIDLLGYYHHETNEAVWGVMSFVINDMKKYVETDEAAEHKLRAFVRSLAAPQYERLGWQEKAGEPEADTKLRSLIISLMLYGQDPAVEATAVEIFNTTSLNALDPNLRVAIMAHAVRQQSPPTIIDDLLDAYKSTSSSELKEDIAAALTATKSSEVGERLLTLLKDASIIRPQDMLRWFVWLLGNRYNKTHAWQWVRQEWPWIESTFGSDKSYDIYPRYIASLLVTHAQLDEYRAFFTPLLDQIALKRNIEIGFTELEHRVRLIETEGPAVRQALLDL